MVGDRYQLLREIGRGGMSIVWLSMDQNLGKQWAVKEIRFTGDPAQREVVVNSLVTEANLIKGFDHVAIPRIVDIVQEGEVLYVVMDYVDGVTLESLMQSESALAEDDVADWAIQLCDVLDYLHQQDPPIVYCDMKPSNIILRPDGTVRLIDFGIARPEHGSHNAEKDGRHLGTEGYAAPEQHGDGDIDRRVDVFGMGATMYALLTGTKPSDDLQQVVPLRQLRPELSEGIERVVTKAMSQNRDDRYAGAAELAYALERYKADDDAHKRTLKRKWYAFVGSIAVAVALLVVGLGTMVTRNFLLSRDYDYWMQVADQSADVSTAEDDYANAIAADPTATEPYERLFRLYLQDGDFDSDEELQFARLANANIDSLKSNSQDYASFCLDTGRMYWFYYNVSSDSSDASYARLRSASRWMHEAANVVDFSDHDIAQAYADVADFTTDITPRIEEGTDAGLYAPEFARLQTLVASTSQSDNDVFRLNTAQLVLDALRAYPRKFRADGVSRDDLEALVANAHGLTQDVSSTSSDMDATLADLNEVYPATRQAVEDAFVDVTGNQQ